MLYPTHGCIQGFEKIGFKTIASQMSVFQEEDS